MNIYETPLIKERLQIYKTRPNDCYLTKEMLDDFLTPQIIRYYELCLKARRQNKKYFNITDTDIKFIITQSYLNILKQIDRGVKPIIANKIRELFGMITYNVMSNEIKLRQKYKYEYLDNINNELEQFSEQIEDIEDKKFLQEHNHNLYLKVMEIAQKNLTKVELDCFVFKYYSNYTNKEIQNLLGLSNINKVSSYISSAENKLKLYTKNLKLL